MKVLDLMSTSVLTIKANESIIEAAKAMVRHDHGMLIVVDSLNEKKMVGVVTDNDIIAKVVAKQTDSNIAVSEIMSKNVTSVQAQASIEDAKQLLHERHIKRLPVMHENQLVGILSYTDILKL